MDKKVLVTGGAGYIGSHMVYLLVKAGFDVVVWDNLSRGFRESLDALREDGCPGTIEFQELDLGDREAVMAAFENFEAVFHFAAFCSVDESTKDPQKYFANNVSGTLNLLEAMKENGCQYLVFSSTCAVYGDGQYFPVDEKHPLNPTSPYGESKLMAERLIQWYGDLFGMKYALLRYFNVCGAHEKGVIGDAKKPSVHLVQNVVRGGMGIEDFYLTCNHVDTPDGTPIRDYIDVLDLCAAHEKAYEYLKDGGDSGAFNLGNGKGISVKEIIQAVEEDLEVEIPVNDDVGKKRSGESAKIFADMSKAAAAFGWEPQRSISESVEALRRWYTKRPRGW